MARSSSSAADRDAEQRYAAMITDYLLRHGDDFRELADR